MIISLLALGLFFITLAVVASVLAITLPVVYTAIWMLAEPVLIIAIIVIAVRKLGGKM